LDECASNDIPSMNANLYVMELPDSVIVVPVTPDGEFVLVEQYRHGADQWVLECPGGNREDEEHLETAVIRELLEETGYRAESITPLNSNPQEPSCQSGRCFAYLALGCELETQPMLDTFEALRVRRFTREKLWEAIHAGSDFHIPSLAALLQVLSSPALVSG
ncbi:MAG: NUDIX hydrolase, partial [Pseudomonadota bacterium]